MSTFKWMELCLRTEKDHVLCTWPLLRGIIVRYIFSLFLLRRKRSRAQPFSLTLSLKNRVDINPRTEDPKFPLSHALFPPATEHGTPNLPPLLSLLLSLSHFPTPSLFDTGSIGINYDRVADNLPQPSKVVQLLKTQNINRVKLYDTDPTLLPPSLPRRPRRDPSMQRWWRRSQPLTSILSEHNYFLELGFKIVFLVALFFLHDLILSGPCCQIVTSTSLWILCCGLVENMSDLLEWIY